MSELLHRNEKVWDHFKYVKQKLYYAILLQIGGEDLFPAAKITVTYVKVFNYFCHLISKCASLAYSTAFLRSLRNSLHH